MNALLKLPAVAAHKELGWRISPREARICPNARTVVFHIAPRETRWPRTAPHRLLRRLLSLLRVHWTAYAVHRVTDGAVFCIDESNALALRISEEAAQLETWHGGFTPARAAAIARRERATTIAAIH